MWDQRCLDFDNWNLAASNELVVPSHKAQAVQKWVFRLDSENLVARNEKVCTPMAYEIR